MTLANKRQIEVLRQCRAEREAHEFNTMTELAKGVAKLICIIKVKAGEDGKMFGSVTAGVIADELKHQFDITLDKRKIHLEHPIRALGDHKWNFTCTPRSKATSKSASKASRLWLRRGLLNRKKKRAGNPDVKNTVTPGGTPKAKRPESSETAEARPKARST